MEGRKGLRISSMAAISKKMGEKPGSAASTSFTAPEVDYFILAEKFRMEAIAIAIQECTLATTAIQERLQKAFKNYQLAIAHQDYRAICSTKTNEKGVMGGLYSLNDLLHRAGLLTEEHKNYFIEHFAAGIAAKDKNCLYLRDEQAKLKNAEQSNNEEELSLSGSDTELYDCSSEGEVILEELEELAATPSKRMV